VLQFVTGDIKVKSSNIHLVKEMFEFNFLDPKCFKDIASKNIVNQEA